MRQQKQVQKQKNVQKRELQMPPMQKGLQLGRGGSMVVQAPKGTMDEHNAPKKQSGGDLRVK